MKLGSCPIGCSTGNATQSGGAEQANAQPKSNTQLQGTQCNNATQPEEEVAAQDLAVLVPGANEVDRVDRLALLPL